MYAIVFVTLLSQAPPPPPLDYYVEQAVLMGCDEHLARELLNVEELAGVPERLRGMLLAKASHESRFIATATGDNGKAVGLLQLWPWALKYIPDRTDPIASAHTFLGAVLFALRRVPYACPKARDRWVTAWIRINRGPTWRRPDKLGEPRCGGSLPRGLKILRRWRRAALSGR